MFRPLYNVVLVGMQLPYHICMALCRIVGEVMRLNYELITAIVRLVQDFMDVTVSLAVIISSAVADIAFHIVEFLSHIWLAACSYADLLHQFMSPLIRQCILFIIYLSEGLAYGIQVAWFHVRTAVIAGVSLLQSFVDNWLPSISSAKSHHRISTDYSKELTDDTKGSSFSEWMESYVASLDSWLKDSITSVTAQIQESWYQLTSNCTMPLMQTVESISAMPHFTYTACLMLVPCSIVLLISSMLLRLMKNKGLTVPFLHQVYSRGSSDNLDVLLQDAMDSDSASSSESEIEEQPSEPESNENDSLDELEGDEQTPVDSSENEEEVSDHESVNFVDVQLPEKRVTRQSARRSPSPLATTSTGAALSPDHLQQILESEKDKQRCVVCQDNPKNVLVLPCRHMCLCVDCAHEIAHQRRRERQVCPLCRTPMETVMNVYT